MKVLVVDDEEKIRKILAAYLKTSGFEVETAADGMEALEKAKGLQPDLILLDIMLPGIDGWRVCQEIRSSSRVPIIMLSACYEEMDRIKGLELGADDYITKPFSPLEVIARIKAVMRRIEPLNDNRNLLRIGRIALDRGNYTAKVNDNQVELTPTEYGILETLMANPNRVFTRLQLIEKIQGYAYEGYERTYDSHIKNLRKKVEDDPSNPRYIKTVYGVGYKMAEEENG